MFVHLIKTKTPKTLQSFFAGLLNALLNFGADAASADAQRVCRQAQTLSQVPAFLNFILPVALIIRKDQVAIRGRQLFQAAIEVCQQALFLIARKIKHRSGGESSAGLICSPQIIQRYLSTLCVPEMLQKNKFRSNVTIMGWREIDDLTLLVKLLRHARQCFVSKSVGGETVFAIKVGNEPAVHFQVLFAAGIHTLIQPMEKVLK